MAPIRSFCDTLRFSQNVRNDMGKAPVEHKCDWEEESSFGHGVWVRPVGSLGERGGRVVIQITMRLLQDTGIWRSDDGAGY